MRLLTVTSGISIHAPHEGERLYTRRLMVGFVPISIHAPHEGERPCRCPKKAFYPVHFNPRSPRGGATWRGEKIKLCCNIFQSTLPTRGSDTFAHLFALQLAISIHAPHEGERLKLCNRGTHYSYFNPRSPRGGATDGFRRRFSFVGISIHAPHEGERRIPRCALSLPIIFQSTLPTRGSDCVPPCICFCWP